MAVLRVSPALVGEALGFAARVRLEEARRLSISIAKSIAPRQTGALAKSIDATPVVGHGPNAAFQLYARAPYALMVHEGTRPHPIDPTSISGKTPFVFSRGPRGARLGRIWSDQGGGPAKVGGRPIKHPSEKLAYFSGARALHWEGARHPVKHVDHPGTDPNAFLIRAAREALGRV